MLVVSSYILKDSGAQNEVQFKTTYYVILIAC